MTRKRKPPQDRFWAKVDKNGPTPEHRPDLGPCWVWTGARKGKGYGSFFLDGKCRRAHRVAFEWQNGSIPNGLQTDHLCRNRLCVNPDHLEAVDNRTNSLRGVGFVARHAQQTHCLRGHPFTPENTKLEPDKYGLKRRCLTCRRQRARARYHAQKVQAA